MKKSISIILALLMAVSVFSIMPITANATISGDWEYDYYDYDGDKLFLTNYSGSSSSVTIPATIDGQPVFGIDCPFRGNKTITSVIFSEGIEILGGYSFEDCSNLAYVSLPDSLTEIGYNAFKGTAFINNSAYYEGGALYAGKHLIRVKYDYSGDVTVKKGTLTVARDAFSGCSNIKNITIPNGIRNNGIHFDDCINLNTLILGEGITDIYGPIKCVNLVVPTTVKYIGSEILDKPDIYNPDYENLHYGVDNVYFCRFKNESSLWETIYTSTTTIPHGHSTIWIESSGRYGEDVNFYYGYTPKGRHRVIFKKSGGGAEPYSQVVEDNETVIDPSNIWGIYDYKIVGEDPWEHWEPIEGYPTYYKDLEYYSDKKCTVPYDFNTPVTSDITIYCKDKGSTDPIVYDGYVTTYGALIWKYAPDTCTFTVERTPNFYYDDSFEEYLLEAKHLVVEDSVDAIGEAIMLNSENLETVKIAGSVKSIGADCFQNCPKLNSVTLGEGIETIGSGAFSELPLVSEIKIPDSVKTISDGAFLSNSDNFKLIGKAGSAAQTYAKANGIKFEVKNAETFKVTFDANGGSGIMYDETAAEGSEFLVPDCDFDAPKGMEFDCWTYNGNKYYSDDLIPVTEDIVLTANWVKSTEEPEETTVPEITTVPEETTTATPKETTVPVDKPTEPQETTAPVDKPTEPQETTAPVEKPTEPQETTVPVDKPTEPIETQPLKTDISKWNVSGIKNMTYTGKVLKQDNILVSKDSEYADFSVKYKNNVNVGTATITITGTGDYTGTIVKSFKINKAENTVKVTAKKAVKAKAKKKTTIKKAITVKNAQGKVTYKTNNKKVTVKKGNLIVAKGFKKGKTIKVKITITAKGNNNYKSQKVVKTIKIKVK